jgi:hypothetical protein
MTPATVADLLGDPRGLEVREKLAAGKIAATETAIAALSALPRSVEAP